MDVRLQPPRRRQCSLEPLLRRALHVGVRDSRGTYLVLHRERLPREPPLPAVGTDLLLRPRGCWPPSRGRRGAKASRTTARAGCWNSECTHSPVAREAQAWLEKTRARVDWYLARHMPPHLSPWDGPELYPTCPDFAPTELSRLRRQMSDLVLKLQ